MQAAEAQFEEAYASAASLSHFSLAFLPVSGARTVSYTHLTLPTSDLV